MASGDAFKIQWNIQTGNCEFDGRMKTRLLKRIRVTHALESQRNEREIETFSRASQSFHFQRLKQVMWEYSNGKYRFRRE